MVCGNTHALWQIHHFYSDSGYQSKSHGQATYAWSRKLPSFYPSGRQLSTLQQRDECEIGNHDLIIY